MEARVRFEPKLKLRAAGLLVLALATGARADGPAGSAPIALTPDDAFVWMVNPDNDSVSVFDVRNDLNARIALLETGREPDAVAIHPNGQKAYVTNIVDGTLSIFRIDPVTGIGAECNVLRVGTEPHGVLAAPDGRRLFVANAASDTVTVVNVDPRTDPECRREGNPIVRTIPVGNDPRALAITPDGTKLYVTHFFAQLRPGKTPADEGRDDQREGRVTVISARTLRVIDTVEINPLAETGFRSDGSTLDRDSCQAAGCPTARTDTGAFPNLMTSIAIKGDRAYLPSTGSSPNGPFRFNVNVQGLLNVFDVTSDQDSGQTINMNRGINQENEATRLFITAPRAIAFKHAANEGFVVPKAINQIVRVVLDADGTPTIDAPTPVRVNVGKDPRGIVIDSGDTRAYVMNFISRDLTVVDVSTATPSVVTTVAQPDLLPLAGSLDETVHRGKELFNAGIGPVGVAPQSDAPAGRMSSEGWGSCYGCHEDGRTDTVTWMFPDGPRQAISMDGTFDPHQPDLRRILNWSAVRDETQDFERNIRAVSGGEGLIPDVPITDVPDLTPIANTGRNADLDSIETYLQFGVRSRVAPPTNLKDSVKRGRQVFASAGCAECHGGGAWTRAIRDFTPPPVATEIVDAQLIRFLDKVGTFDASLFTDGVGNEIRANTVNTNVQARGTDGLNPPSLLSVFATQPYFHSGSASSLEEVIALTPRNADDVHVVELFSFRRDLIRFLLTIDDTTEPFPLP